VIYRDHTEACPRCAVDLVDAGSVRACTNCQGMWLAADVLTEMVATMQPEPRWVELDFEPDPRAPLACPTCVKPMATWSLLGVPIDRCDDHGIWFDHDELEQVLRTSAEPAAPIDVPQPEPADEPTTRRRREAAAFAVGIRRRVIDRQQDMTHVGSATRDPMPRPDEPE